MGAQERVSLQPLSTSCDSGTKPCAAGDLWQPRSAGRDQSSSQITFPTLLNKNLSLRPGDEMATLEHTPKKLPEKKGVRGCCGGGHTGAPPAPPQVERSLARGHTTRTRRQRTRWADRPVGRRQPGGHRVTGEPGSHGRRPSPAPDSAGQRERGTQPGAPTGARERGAATSLTRAGRGRGAACGASRAARTRPPPARSFAPSSTC